MSHVVILHPETEALQRELERLRQRSSELYLKVEYMQFEEKQVLYSLYETQIGKLEFEEFQLKVEIRLLTYETKLVHSYINRNERIDEGRIAEQVKFAQGILSTETLEDAMPGFRWNGGHSGRVLPVEYEPKLHALWNEYLEMNDDFFSEKKAARRVLRHV